MKTIKTRLGSLLLIGAACLLGHVPAFAGAAAHQIDMEIDDQPGYTPSPEEENLVGPYERQIVFFRTTEQPGTIVVHTADRYLYLVQPNNRAIRYGIGVGRPGFEWSGVKTVSRKSEWPDWTPPREMLKRRPDLPRHMHGGAGNPLGARALYLGGSMYRIHGTNEPETIGHNVSSGCIRMMNEDVVDLYNRVRVGTKDVVR